VVINLNDPWDFDLERNSKSNYMIESLEELKKEKELIDSIDWEMTPEQAVRVYLEWGNIYARGDGHVVRSKDDYTIYFVVNCWDRPYQIFLIKRNSQEAIELAKFRLPERFEKPICELKGVYAVEGEIKEWLMKELDAG
jgi:hypothetical protein